MGLADLSGKPGLLYQTSLPQQLNFSLGTDYTGASWSSAAAISSQTASREPHSLALVDGCPAAAYQRQVVIGRYAIFYRRASDAAGTSWGSEETVVNVSSYANGSAGIHLLQLHGMLALATQQDNSGHLYFFRSDPANPGTWLSTGVDGISRTGNYPAWALLGGRPTIASQYNGGDAVVLRRADDVLGDTWPTDPQVVDDGAAAGKDIGYHTQLVVINGTPVIAYYNETDSKLRVASLIEQ